MGRRVFFSSFSYIKRNPSRALRLGLFAVGLGAAVLVPAPGNAQSARSWNKQGQAAELREDYDAAYEAYRQAHLKAPADIRYKTRYERLRFLAATSHVDRGRVLKQSGDTPAAINEFTRAIAIDPSNQTATQELNIILHPDNLPPPAGAPPTPGENSLEQTPYQAETLRNINSVAGPVQLQPVSNDPITLHAVEDTKFIYQAIGKVAGLNVLFDPDYQSKRIPVDLSSVTLTDALRIVGTLAGTFYKPVTSNTIFVAQNSRSKRTDLDELSVQTFYLTNIAQANDLNEILTTVRNILDPSVKIYSVASQNALILRATPDQLLLAQKIINDLDRARSEVVVDVAVLEVNRDRMRNLGITLPQSIGLTPQANSSTTTSSTGSTATTTTGSTTSGFTLNTLGNLNATNFAVSLTGGTLSALLNDSDTRILQNPRIRATDGQRATLKIGSRIPIATGSYSSGVSTGTVSLGVQTQFTYLDVGVNIDVTPTVHYDREVTLKLKIEVSAQNGSVTISSVTEPIIAQRVIEQVIQLREGEPSILAGILTKQDNHVNAGTPGLADIPLLKYIFGSQNTEKQQDEVVFLLIPHIVRESVLTRLNTAAIDTGTSTTYELRRTADAGTDANQSVLPPRPAAKATGPATTSANAAAAMVQQMAQQAAPLQPGAAPATSSAVPVTPAQASTAAQVPSGPVTLSVVPVNANQTVGNTFQVAIAAANGHDLYSVPVQLQFDPKVLQLVNVDSGEFLGRDGQTVAIVHRDEGNGLVTISTSRPPNVKGVEGQGNICTLTFKAVGPGDSNLALTKVGARNSAQASLPVVGSQAVIHVK